jgi:transposase
MEPGWSSTRSAGASLGSNSSGPTAATTHGKLRLRRPRCRWVVERTFSWFGRNRRLAKDFENLAETLASFVTLASIQLAVRRLARA